MIYRVDTSNYDDTRWRVMPLAGGPQWREDHQFPGVAAIYRTVGPAMPGGFEITGMIGTTQTTAALARQAMIDLYRAWDAERASLITRTLTLDAGVYPYAHLDSFEFTGPAIEVATASNVRIERPCRFLWRLLG